MTHWRRRARRCGRGTRFGSQLNALDYYFGVYSSAVLYSLGLGNPEFNEAERARRRKKGRVAKASLKSNRP